MNQHLVVHAVTVKVAHCLEILDVILRLKQFLDAVLNAGGDLFEPVLVILFFVHMHSFPKGKTQSRSLAPAFLFYCSDLGCLLLSGGIVPASLARLLAASRRALETGSRMETQLFGTM